MEDIEDVIASGTPPGLRLPLTTVSINPRRKPKSRVLQDPVKPSAQIPGTQTIFVKTFGCSHNQSDSEYMAGQLSAFGYALTDISEEADLWLINTCTVKSPSQSAMETLISKGKNAKKPLVVAGCVPQGSRDIKELEGISIIGVQQIDRVVEVVEETLKGHEVRLLSRKTLPALDLPKVRKNKYVEILPINVGCLGACTYCKTKHARGHLGSYTVESLVERLRTVISEGVKEIWLSSEDTGAYGRDIGVNLPILLNALIAELPPDRSTMLRIGMTNPPFILEHLEEIAKVLRHPCVYSFLHVPVQSGSDAVLDAMNREYTVSDFRAVVDTLIRLVPDMQIATDVICGFPGETDEDFAQTIALIKEYKFPQVHISQFYPRPGTPAARMKKVPSTQVKNRSRELTSIFESFNPYTQMEGQIVKIWITEIASDGIHLVGHTKGYVQVLVIAPDNMLGTSKEVKITSVGRWSVFGEVIETSTEVKAHRGAESACDNLCPCSSESECNSTNLKKCAEIASITHKEASADNVSSSSKNGRLRTFISSIKPVLLRRRFKGSEGNQSIQKIEDTKRFVGSNLSMVDGMLVGGLIVSLLTIILVFTILFYQMLSS
ncbi:threonylcarbamoyladenosine tRNA methylthiotransferase isoform X1 [Dendrobium catenatum]|uniref:threonylcarbamoyladenosine tRNA methylthiotransferase isoform X1 n=1 Tax=Dendrobium catenatum TaxID=906689 RepID=UPI0009F6485C|nr:threonylcarbamoyladenosine tRNA methylthiotransferase isoform X1 [Dendrobium catenatum]